MNAREVLKSAVICAIAQICALATPAWSAPARKHEATTHKSKAHTARPQLLKPVVRKRVASKSSAGKRRTSHVASTPRAGQRPVASAVAPAVTPPMISTALTLGWWAQCGFPTSPFSFTSLRSSSPLETAPIVAAGVAVDLPAQPAPPSGPVVTADPDMTIEPVAPAEPVAPTVPAALAVEPAADPVEPIAYPIEPAAYVLKPVADSAIGSTLSLPLRESEPANVAPDPVRFIGLVEARTGDFRVAVLRIADRIVYGRQGDIIGGRYRLLSFTEDAALIFDLSASVTRTLAMGSP